MRLLKNLNHRYSLTVAGHEENQAIYIYHRWFVLQEWISQR